ncbi:hypothetical protein CVIRNUC_003273 [Coccomyxa viridis]|uniref:Uncharacterized protein n=1 Tax=Coccomyxa viridis TaxID=1274662 RepID=A0AAV1HYY6_9CHLO|nr:hypothetical protein CVIRNUC_003273 [Coccomyxa viridis]
MPVDDDYFAARRALETARESRRRTVCGTYPGPLESYRYIPERCQKIRPRAQRSQRRPTPSVRQDTLRHLKSHKSSLRRLLRKTQRQRQEADERAFDARVRNLGVKGQQHGFDADATVVIKQLFKSFKELPEFIEFVYRRFTDPGLVTSVPDPEKRYKRSVELWKQRKGDASLDTIDVQRHIISMALHA